LVSQPGIFKPAILPEVPLTIRTAPEEEGRARPYADEMDSEGRLRYRYRGTDPRHPDNVGLRRAMQRRLPLIYLFGVVPGQYMPVWPVYVVGDEPATLSFLVSVDDQQHALPATSEDSRVVEARRAYVTVVTQRRLHQQTFRQRVLRAYQERCAICRLRHRELLEAAHILPDGDPRGEPIVSNGVALCKLHHAAFDRYILGIRPDLLVDSGWMSCARRTGPCSSTGCRGSRAYGSRSLTMRASSRIASGSPSDTRSSRERVEHASLRAGVFFATCSRGRAQSSVPDEAPHLPDGRPR
jgi:putative restriction endonuclease